MRNHSSSGRWRRKERAQAASTPASVHRVPAQCQEILTPPPGNRPLQLPWEGAWRVGTLQKMPAELREVRDMGSGHRVSRKPAWLVVVKGELWHQVPCIHGQPPLWPLSLQSLGTYLTSPQLPPTNTPDPPGPRRKALPFKGPKRVPLHHPYSNLGLLICKLDSHLYLPCTVVV